MKQVLLVLGGILNLLFGMFHIWLGWNIHQMAHLSPDDRALMEMLNVGGMLLIFFFAYVSLFRKEELLTTGLGQAVLVLVLLLYLSRAVEEIVLSPTFSVAIFAACLAVAGVYLPVLIGNRRPR